MNSPLVNLKLLRDDMRSKGWIVDVFSFPYKEQTYLVVIELFQEGEKVPDYALCKLRFMRKGNLGDELTAPANSRGIMIEAKRLREYFGIEYSPNLGDLLGQFAAQLGRAIPKEVSSQKSNVEKQALVYSLSHLDSEDPRKRYCYKVKRNPMRKDGLTGRRSVFNDNKTRVLRPVLYDALANDPHLSFCYSDDASMEKSDEEILSSMVKDAKNDI